MELIIKKAHMPQRPQRPLGGTPSANSTEELNGTAVAAKSAKKEQAKFPVFGREQKTPHMWFRNFKGGTKDGVQPGVSGGAVSQSPEVSREQARKDLKNMVDGKEEPREFLGVPKFWWAFVADILALLAFVTCIPCVLTVAKRRRVT